MSASVSSARRSLQNPNPNPAKGQYDMSTRSSRRASVDTVKQRTGLSSLGEATRSTTKEDELARQREKSTATRSATRPTTTGRSVSEFGELQRHYSRKDAAAYAPLSKRPAEAVASDPYKATQTSIIGSRHRSDSNPAIGAPRPLKRLSTRVQAPSSPVARTAEALPNIRVVSPPSDMPARSRSRARAVSDPPPQSHPYPASAQNQPPTTTTTTRVRTASNSSTRIMPTAPTTSIPPRPRTASGSSTMPTPPPRYSNLSSRPPSRQSDRSRSSHNHVAPTNAPISAPLPTPTYPAPTPAPGRFPRGILRRRPYPPKSLTVGTSSRTVSLQAPHPSSSSSPRSPSIVDLVRRLSKKRVRFKSVSSRRTISDAGTPYASPAHSPPRRRTTRDLPPDDPLRRRAPPVWRSGGAASSGRVPSLVQPIPGTVRTPSGPVRPVRRAPSPIVNPPEPPPYAAASTSSTRYPSAGVSTRTYPPLSQHASVAPRRAPSPMNPPRVVPPTPVNAPRTFFGPSPTQSPHIIPAPPSPLMLPRGISDTPPPLSRRTRAPSPALGMSLVGVEGPYPAYLGSRRRNSASLDRRDISSDRPSVLAAPRRTNIPPPAPAINLSVDPRALDDDDDDDDEEPVVIPSIDRWGSSRGVFGRLGWRTRSRSNRMYGDDSEAGEEYYANARRRRWRSFFTRWGRRVGGGGSPWRSVRARLSFPWLRKRRSTQRFPPNPDLEPDLMRPSAVERSPSLPPLPPPSPVRPPVALPPTPSPPRPPPPPVRSRTPTPQSSSLHPLLRAPSRSHPGHLAWDMRYPDLPSQYATSPFVKQSLHEPATNPPSEMMTLLIPIPSSSRSRSSSSSSYAASTAAAPPRAGPQFWATTLKPPPRISHVKCIDLLKSAASLLRQPLSQVELSSLAASPRRLALVQRAFERRCRAGDAMGQRAEEKERRMGMRRVDLLGGNVVWKGVKWLDEADAWVVELGETEI